MSGGRFSSVLVTQINSHSGTAFDELKNRITILSIQSLARIIIIVRARPTALPSSSPETTDKERSSEVKPNDLIYLVCLVAIIPIAFILCFILKKRRKQFDANISTEPDLIPTPISQSRESPLSSLSIRSLSLPHIKSTENPSPRKSTPSYQSKENPLNSANPFRFASDAYYDVLGLTLESATTVDIKKSYEKLKALYNPNTDSSPEAAEMLFKIEEAYQTLLSKHTTMDEAGNSWNFKSMSYE